MKNTATLLAFLLLSLGSFGQDSTIAQPIDSSLLPITITLKAKHHAYIIGFLNDFRNVQAISYVNQLRAAFDTSFQPSKTVAITTTNGFLIDVYNNMGRQQKRIAAKYNDEIKKELLPQISTNAYVVNRLSQADKGGDNEAENRIKEAIKFVMSIKK